MLGLTTQACAQACSAGTIFYRVPKIALPTLGSAGFLHRDTAPLSTGPLLSEIAPSIDMTTPLTRPRCAQCLRALRGCICALVQPVSTDVQVLILQHPMELHEVKGTARLLHLSLGNRSHLEVGEAFAPERLQVLLHAPWRTGDTARQALLLYPSNDAVDTASVPPINAISHTPRELRLVVIDGTWRKSRKMVYANPLLQALPRLALTDVLPAQYRIRKSQRDGQLSTMEATSIALAQLHAWPEESPDLDHLHRMFAQFMDHHEQLHSPPSPLHS